MASSSAPSSPAVTTSEGFHLPGTLEESGAPPASHRRAKASTLQVSLITNEMHALLRATNLASSSSPSASLGRRSGGGKDGGGSKSSRRARPQSAPGKRASKRDQRMTGGPGRGVGSSGRPSSAKTDRRRLPSRGSAVRGKGRGKVRRRSTCGRLDVDFDELRGHPGGGGGGGGGSQPSPGGNLTFLNERIGKLCFHDPHFVRQIKRLTRLNGKMRLSHKESAVRSSEDTDTFLASVLEKQAQSRRAYFEGISSANHPESPDRQAALRKMRSGGTSSAGTSTSTEPGTGTSPGVKISGYDPRSHSLTPHGSTSTARSRTRSGSRSRSGSSSSKPGAAAADPEDEDLDGCIAEAKALVHIDIQATNFVDVLEKSPFLSTLGPLARRIGVHHEDRGPQHKSRGLGEEGFQQEMYASMKDKHENVFQKRNSIIAVKLHHAERAQVSNKAKPRKVQWTDKDELLFQQFRHEHRAQHGASSVRSHCILAEFLRNGEVRNTQVAHLAQTWGTG